MWTRKSQLRRPTSIRERPPPFQNESPGPLTSMPRQTEPSANNAIGGLLQAMMGRSRVHSENTQAIAGHAGLQPDILITATGRSPVVIESEFIPAANVEQEAKDRLGLETSVDGRIIEAVIALRYPQSLRQTNDLRADLKEAKLSYCVFTEESEGSISRFPESGWLDGSVEDLADMVRLVSVPQRAVDQAATILQKGIDGAAKHLDQVSETRPAIAADIARLLGMTNVPQTRRMACAIMANALVFHERIAGMHPNVRSLALVCGDDVANPQAETLAAWQHILTINYFAIFAIAKDILERLDSGDAAIILRQLRNTAQSVRATGVDNSHDLTGRIFQRLIADRKYLATFYTLPASAALLARLAVAKMDGIDWGDLEAIRRLKVGDFACGTGALISAVYEQIAARHERAGGDPEALHKVMIEEVLYGCDVMPSAVHITGSTLSGMEPSVDFQGSRLYTMPYGRMQDGSVMIGSLELLQSSSVLTLFNTSEPARRTGSAGEEAASQVRAEIPDEGFDLVIMNPPFTSNTAKEASHIGTFAPAFAAFNASDKDQRDMSKRLSRLKKGTCYHGHAGMASAFASLAHRKLKPGGILALVLPLTASAASSWRNFRRMLDNGYETSIILSIAAAGNDDVSFSSDTGMAECLVIARKCKSGESLDKRRLFSSLTHRPKGLAHARILASKLSSSTQRRQVADGPYGGTPLVIGDDRAGEGVIASHHEDGEVWGAVRITDYSIAQTSHALSQSKLWLPASDSSLTLRTAPLDDMGALGLYDLDITGNPPQGPFTKSQYSPTATYPSLWNHNAKKETRMVCLPDSQLLVRPGMEVKAAKVWSTASRAHINRDFRFNSQPISVAITEMPTIGGRAWPNVRFANSQFDSAFAVWGNNTLGLICHWWHSNRQAAGRGTISIRSADSLPVLDFRALTDEQLMKAEAIFDEFRDKELMPAFLADADPNRALLDHRVVCDLLGFDEDVYVGVRRLAAKWCAEPSVHGGKKRPKGATLVV